MEQVRDNLIFSLDSWPEAGVTCDFVLSPNSLIEAMAVEQREDPPKFLTSMRGQLDIQLMGRKLRVKGAFAVKVELTCSRCLTNFSGKITDLIDEFAIIGEQNQAQGSDGEFDEDAIPIVNSQFNLAPLMLEFFWVNWPTKALCRPDCSGLCPSCGVNLNEESCNCKQSPLTRH
ncbi:MAG: DUF177 domain-containing protein [Deltaproteobacteria bacterium]|nr:DUF177 domain-containing protein [Deltaproteobacteria bacterium]